MKFDLIDASTRQLLRLALAEDLGTGDATTAATVASNLEGQADIVVKQAGVLAGIPVFCTVFELLDPGVRVAFSVRDGSEVASGTVAGQVRGKLQSILSGERLALNFLCHLSGVASLTHEYVQRVQGTKAVILDTRKTTPLWRKLEKYAVRCGGGSNHRFGLHDMVLIKDNHVAVHGDVRKAIWALRASGQAKALAVEVEVRNLEELEVALAEKPDRILLDNFSVADMAEAVRRTAGRVPLEASGRMNLMTVGDVAATGVDFISVGALTHSAPILDISLEIEPHQPAS